MSPALWTWVPAILWAVALFAASSIQPTGVSVRIPIPHADKLIHGTLYAVLAALVYRGIRASCNDTGPGRAVILAAVLSTLYGVTDEFHQSFVPGRTPDGMDLLADAAGSLIGAAAWAGLTRSRPLMQAPNEGLDTHKG